MNSCLTPLRISWHPRRIAICFLPKPVINFTGQPRKRNRGGRKNLRRYSMARQSMNQRRSKRFRRVFAGRSRRIKWWVWNNRKKASTTNISMTLRPPSITTSTIMLRIELTMALCLRIPFPATSQRQLLKYNKKLAFSTSSRTKHNLLRLLKWRVIEIMKKIYSLLLIYSISAEIFWRIENPQTRNHHVLLCKKNKP